MYRIIGGSSSDQLTDQQSMGFVKVGAIEINALKVMRGRGPGRRFISLF